MRNILQLLIAILLVTSCQKEAPHSYNFYYWRTDLRLDQKEQEALQKATAPITYVRFFDVDKQNDKFLPLGILTNNAKTSIKEKVTPVIFITNRTWLNIKPEEIDFLVSRIIEFTDKTAKDNSLSLTNEIQIDSDWTAGTRNDYFAFLKALKKATNKTTSCTIRMHQVKDKTQTGIPPVDKGYLMCYATSSPLENSDKNSILDVTLLQNYLSKIDEYKLPLDIALPIYSWGIVTNHVGKHRLINAVSKESLLKEKNLKKTGDNKFVATEDFWLGDFYLNKGFEIKVEEISQEDLNKVKSFLDKKLKHYNILYYQLDSRFLNYQL